MPEHALLSGAVHHIVHDYANLVSSGTMAVHGHHLAVPLEPPLNTHVSQAFLLNCRKMRGFFATERKYERDIIAADFLATALTFELPQWDEWHKHMDKHLMHLSYERVGKARTWVGDRESRLFLGEFMRAWKTFRDNLADEYQLAFHEEIAAKLGSEFRDLDLW